MRKIDKGDSGVGSAAVLLRLKGRGLARPAEEGSLFRRLSGSLRAAILDGSLSGGTRLPPSRTGAELLGISRNTVVAVYEQLTAEGYLAARTGAGTFVVELPSGAGHGRGGAGNERERATQSLPRESRRASGLRHLILGRRRIAALVPFRPGLPALDEVPMREWLRLQSREARRLLPSDFTYGDPCGLPVLREALAAYLRLSRAVHCKPEQILVVNGSQEALHLCALVLGDVGGAAYIEDPGYPGARAAFASAGLRIHPVPLDDEGVNVAAARRIMRRPGILYTTPSHQFPLGTAMGTARRLEILRLVERTRSVLVEDDYDSEYRYAGEPLPSLQGLAARHGTARDSVVYVGTFSKVLFPGLRIGYLVVPAHLTETFARVRALLSRHSPALPQAALAAFLKEGGFYRHVRRMRRLYSSRRAVLMGALEQYIGERARIVSGPGGMHVAVILCEHRDVDVAEAARSRGIEAPPISELCVKYPVNGLALGFAGFPERALEAATKKLALAFDDSPRLRPRRRGKPRTRG